MNPAYLINQDSPQVFGVSGVAKISDLTNSGYTLAIQVFAVFVLVSCCVVAFKLLSASAGNINQRAEYKEGVRRIIYGLIIITVVSILILSLTKGFTFLDGLSGSTQNTAVNTLAPSARSTGGQTVASSQSCVNAQLFKDTLSIIGDGVCGGALCSKTCNFDPAIKSIAVAEAQSAGVAPGIVLALICRESSGIADKQGNHANNGKPDCGLMQINSPSCTPEIMNPTNNIRAGIALYKAKLASVSSFSYKGVDAPSMAFAAYNCCSNGDNPNSKSSDCNTSTGWPMDLPKWACPVNPGAGSFNMCAVKNYACDVSACASKY